MHAGFGGQGPLLVTVGSILTFFAFFLVGLRAFAASKSNGRWRWDFIFAALAVCTGSGAIASFLIACSYGLGNDAKNVPILDLFQMIYWIYTSIWTGLVAATFAKASMVALMLQVQGPSAKKRRYALIALSVLFTVVNFVQVFLSMLQCSPANKLWKPYLAGSCKLTGVATDFSYFQGAVGVFADFVLALWPVSIAWNLQTTMQVKVGFCALLALGLIPGVASLVRNVELKSALTSSNATQSYGPFMLWAVVELWLIIILTSIPVLRPLFLRVFYGIKEKASSGSHSGRQSRVSAAKSTDKSAPGGGGSRMQNTPSGRHAKDELDEDDAYSLESGSAKAGEQSAVGAGVPVGSSDGGHGRPPGSSGDSGAITVVKAFSIQEGRNSLTGAKGKPEVRQQQQHQ